MSKRVNNKRGSGVRSVYYGHPTKASAGSKGDRYAIGWSIGPDGKRVPNHVRHKPAGSKQRRRIAAARANKDYTNLKHRPCYGRRSERAA